MKDGELLRAKRVFDMDGLILVPERLVVASILFYFNLIPLFFRMSLDPLRTVNMVVAKDYWMSRRAMEEKCKGRRKFRVQQRRKVPSRPVVGHQGSARYKDSPGSGMIELLFAEIKTSYLF